MLPLNSIIHHFKHNIKYIVWWHQLSQAFFFICFFFHLREPPYWMLFPVMVDTKLCEGAMSVQIFVCEQSTWIICTPQTPNIEPVWWHYEVVLRCGDILTVFQIFKFFGSLPKIKQLFPLACFPVLPCIVYLCTRHNVSMYYTTQSAIWPIRLYKYSRTLKLLIFPITERKRLTIYQRPWGSLTCHWR